MSCHQVNVTIPSPSTQDGGPGAVKICGRIQVKLDPIPPRRITPDGGISAKAVFNP